MVWKEKLDHKAEGEEDRGRVGWEKNTAFRSVDSLGLQ
jgi:hypothetical protein